MSKKIFLIEDNGFLKDRLTERLEERYGCEVLDAYSVASAKDVWDSERGNFDCIILDLHINPSGLSPEEIANTTPLFGMKALEHFYQTKRISNESINKKTVLFSKYITAFRESVYRDISFADTISKEGDSIESVMKAVNKLLN